MKFSSCFIAATKEYNDFDRFVPSPYFRKSFVTDSVGTLSLTIAVCGFYELYFNSKRITKGRLAPSFQLFVDKANTFWERFNVKEGDTTTHNHHYFGSVSAIFIKRIAGLDYNPELNNAKRVDITPCFPSELSDAEGYYDTPHGRIKSSWKRVGDSIELSVDAPDDFIGEIRLPCAYAFEDKTSCAVLKSGVYTLRLK